MSRFMKPRTSAAARFASNAVILRQLAQQVKDDWEPPPEYQIPFSESWCRLFQFDFSIFSNLQQLVLVDLYDDLPRWRRHIAQILHSSPSLKVLSLDINMCTLYRAAKQNLNHYAWFFDRLASDYAATGSRPLHLRSLRCGRGVNPTTQDSLRQLTDLAVLEEVYLCNDNGSLAPDLYPSALGDSRSPIDFDAFKPEHCPSLQHFYTSTPALDVYEFLCAFSEDRNASRRLAVRFQDTDVNNDIIPLLFQPDPRHPSLPFRIRMFELRYKCENSLRGGLLEPRPIPAPHDLELVASSNADSLEGLSIILPSEVFEEYRVQVQEFAYPIQYGFPPLDAIESAISKLTRLTQLGLARRDCNRENELCKKAHSSNVEALMAMAQRLARAAPGLVYIRIYRYFWKVLRRKGDVVELVMMHCNEWKHVELFREVFLDPDFSE
ncbi:hypothetical protein N0V88_006998 [Collariella sp. IMI 366227]|nr:hypothetical protein N0V88_006998 [Collariella sp. IMI 366227]